MKRNLLIGTSLAVASFATPEARYVATTDAAFKESTLRADAYVIAVKAFESETTEGRVALKAGETPTTLLNRALSEEAGRQALAGILNAKDDEKSLRAALDDLSSKKGSKEATLAALARALSINPELRKFVEEFRPAFLAQGSVAKKKGDTGSDVQGPVQPVRPDIGKNVPVIVEQPNYVTLSKDVLSAEQALVQAMRDEYSATTAAEEAAEAVKRAQAAKDSASSSLQTATKVAEDAVTKATEAKTALTAAEEALNALNTRKKELDESVKAAETKAAGKVVSSAEVLAFNKLNAEINVLNADIAIKTAAVTAARAKDAEAETASKEAADKAAAAKTAYELAAEAFTAAEKASKEAADKDAAAKTAQAEANTKLAAAMKAALDAATKEAEKASKEAVATKAAADAAEVKKTELQTAAQTAKDRVIELGKRQTGLHSELTAARAVDTANSTAETQAAVKVKEAAVIEIATELAKAEINAKHAEQAADDAVKAAAKTAHDAVNAAEAKEAADSNLSAATEKAKHNTVIQAVKEEIVKQEESRLAAEKQAEAEKVSKDAAEKAAAEKAAAEKAAEIADAVTKALAEAKKTAEDEKEAALAEARKAAEADKAAAVAAAKAQAEVDKAAAADKAAADAAAAAQKAKQEAVDARAKSQNDLTNAALKDAADAAEQRAKEAETAKLAADAAADAAKQAVADAETAKLAAVAAADAAQQAAAKQTAAANAAEQRAAAAQQAVADAAAKQADADKRAAAAETAKLAAEQAAADAKQAADKRAADAVAAKEAAEQAADEAVARSAKTVQDLRIELSRERENNDGLVDQYREARDEISNLQAQLEKLTNEAKALADEAKVYNPDKAFAALISKYEADLRAAQSAKDDAAGTIKTLSSQIIVDNVRLDDDRYTLTEVRALADKNNHPELVKAIDAYSQYSFEFDTTNRVLASANELNVLSEVEGVEGKPSDAVARMINRQIAQKKSEVLNRLLHGEELSTVVIKRVVAEGFKGFKDIVDAYNSVKDLIDEDASETENDEDARTEASVNGDNASGTEAEAPRETEAEAPRAAEPAEDPFVVRAKKDRNELIGQLQTIVKGFDVDTETFNAALTLVSATTEHFRGMLDVVSDPDNRSDLFRSLKELKKDLKKGLNAAITNREGRYESVYTLLRTISTLDKNIQELTKTIDVIQATITAYRNLVNTTENERLAFESKARALDKTRMELVEQIQTIIDSYAHAPRAEAHLDSDADEYEGEDQLDSDADEYEGEDQLDSYHRYEHAPRAEAHASRIQNLTADTLGALKLALAQYNDYLNSIKSRSDKDMLLQSDKDTCERIIAAYGLTLSNIDEDLNTLNDKLQELESSFPQKRADAEADNRRMEELLSDKDVSDAVSLVRTVEELQKLDAELQAERVKAGAFNEGDLKNILDDAGREDEERKAAGEKLKDLEIINQAIQKLEADIAVLKTNLDDSDAAKVDAAKEKAKEFFALEAKRGALDLEIKADTKTLEKLGADYDWLARACDDVKEERKKMILGAPELVTGITTAITTILSPVPAAELEYLLPRGTYERSLYLAPPARNSSESGLGLGYGYGYGDSAQGTVQNVQGAFGGTGQAGGLTMASAVGYSADNTQAPPPPPLAQPAPPAAVNSGNLNPVHQPVDGEGQDPAAQLAPPAAVNSGRASPVAQQAGEGQDPAAVAQAAPPAAVNSGHSTPDNQPAAVGQDDQNLTPEDRLILQKAARMAALRSMDD